MSFVSYTRLICQEPDPDKQLRLCAFVLHPFDHRNLFAMYISALDHAALHRIRQYILLNVPQRYDLNHLAAVSNLTRSKLTRGFRHLFQQSLHEYWLELSMAYAKSELEKGVMVKQIAIDLEYSRTGSFSRAFENFYGIKPSALMRQR